MQVSVSKSTVVPSTHKLARRVASKAKTNKLKPANRNKFLGRAAGGGERRSTSVAVARLRGFTKRIGKLWKLRKPGVNTKQMTRTAGTPAVTYGIDTTGVSNTLAAGAAALRDRQRCSA